MSEREAEAVSLAFIEQYIEAQQAPLQQQYLAGSAFLSCYMPTLERYLHYRMIDVSSVKELAKCRHPEVAQDSKRKVSIRRWRIFENLLKSFGTTETIYSICPINFSNAQSMCSSTISLAAHGVFLGRDGFGRGRAIA